MQPATRRLVLLGLIAIVFSGLLVARNLAAAEWDPTLYTAFGEKATPTRVYAEAKLGEVFLRPEQGHDGKFFFVQANDPLLIHPDENAQVLDRPLYRSQRMLYPLLAGGGGLFSPEVIVWSLIVVNMLALAVGTIATSFVATSMRLSPWWGLAFTFNVGLISEMNIDGAGVVAAAAAFGAVAVLQRGRYSWGVTLLALSALSREPMLIAAAGSAWWFWRYRTNKKVALYLFLVPSALVGLWAIYLRMRIGAADLVNPNSPDSLALPFVGLAKAFSSWMGDPMDLLVGCTMVVVLAVFARRALIDRKLVGWAFLGFVPLSVVLSEAVWHSFFDITRAIAPVLTALVLLIAGAGRAEETPAVHRRIEELPSATRYG
ncbi:MAG: hypothetical protein WA726_06495 [Acidimicrobiia bacterium]